jgi:hypothetical protein
MVAGWSEKEMREGGWVLVSRSKSGATTWRPDERAFKATTTLPATPLCDGKPPRKWMHEQACKILGLPIDATVEDLILAYLLRYGQWYCDKQGLRFVRDSLPKTDLDDILPSTSCCILKGFYVYELVDPRNQEVFYVGKGKGDRVLHHEKAARKPAVQDNPKKLLRIYDIWEAGMQVERRIRCSGLDEATAYRIERNLIRSYPRKQLTNAAPGQLLERDRSKLHAMLLLRRCKGLLDWLVEEPWTDFQIETTLLTLIYLRKLAKEGWEREYEIGALCHQK